MSAAAVDDEVPAITIAVAEVLRPYWAPVEASGRGSLNAFFSDVHGKITAWGIASMISSALLLLAYSYSPRVRRTPGWHFLYSSLCEIYVSFGFVLLSLAGDGGHRPGFDLEHAMCHEYNTLLLSILGFDMAANGWRLFMFVDLIVVYHNPFWPHTTRPVYHVIVAGMAGVWVLTIRNTDLLCLAQGDASVNVLTLTWGLVYAPFVLFVLLGGSLYIMVSALLSRDKTNTHLARLTRQRVMRHCLFYLLLYGVLLGVLSAGYANYQYFSTPLATRQTLAYITAALTSGRPVFGFVGWVLINLLGERCLCCLRCERFCCAPPEAAAKASAGHSPSLRAPLLRHLPRESAPSSAAHAAAAAYDAERAEAGAERHAEAGAEHENESVLANRQGVREAGFKEELRYELVSDVAMSISLLAEREAREQLEALDFVTKPDFVTAAGAAASTAESSPSAWPEPLAWMASPGLAPPVPQQPSPVPSVPSPMPERRKARKAWPAREASQGLAISEREITPHTRHTPPVPRGDAAAADASGRRPPQVDHYAVAHFRAIRDAFGISAASFAAAFQRSPLPEGDAVRHMRESVSEGASGSFFYWVKHPDGSDTGYIVKQITKKEKDTLMNILPAYKAHVQARGGSSLLQYLSCHSMRLRWECAGKVYFVVMRNFFPVRTAARRSGGS